MIAQNSHASSRTTLPRQGYRCIAEALGHTRKSPPAKGCARSQCPKRVLSWATLVLGISPCRVCSFQPPPPRLVARDKRIVADKINTRKLVIGHSIQLGVFHLGFPEDWDVTIGIFPDGEKLLISSRCLDLISRQSERSAQFQVRECSGGLTPHSAG